LESPQHARDKRGRKMLENAMLMNYNCEVDLMNAFSGHAWSSNGLSCSSQNWIVNATRVQISIRAVGFADILASKQKAEKSIMLPSRCRTTDLYWRSQPKSHHFEIDPCRAHNWRSQSKSHLFEIDPCRAKMSASCSDLPRFREFDPRLYAASSELLRLVLSPRLSSLLMLNGLHVVRLFL
jgi:hypothetical protein